MTPGVPVASSTRPADPRGDPIAAGTGLKTGMRRIIRLETPGSPAGLPGCVYWLTSGVERRREEDTTMVYEDLLFSFGMFLFLLLMLFGAHHASHRPHGRRGARTA